MGAAIKPEVEKKPVDPLNQDNSPRAKDRASEEAVGASEEARKGERKRENAYILVFGRAFKLEVTKSRRELRPLKPLFCLSFCFCPFFFDILHVSF
jgi:hypothetical protein